MQPTLVQPRPSAPPPPFKTPEPAAEAGFYRRVVSAFSRDFVGITATGTLPFPSFDPDRLAPDGLPLDVPDVHVGGRSRAKGEVTCGLRWLQLDDGAGRRAMTDLARGYDGGDLAHRFFPTNGSYIDGFGRPVDVGERTLKPDCAYHPYWRTVHGGRLVRGLRSTHALQPGALFTLDLWLPISGVASCKITSHGGRDYLARFEARGFDRVPRQLMRAVSIDQQSRTAMPTSATLSRGGFSSVAVLNRDGQQFPLTSERGSLEAGKSQLPCYDAVFRVLSANRGGGEWVEIAPFNS